MTIGDAIGWMRKRHPRDTALATVDAVNRRDWKGLRGLLADDFFYLDGEGNRIETAERFVKAMNGLVSGAPDFALEIDSVEEAGSMVYMHGGTESEDFRFRSRSMWRAKVEHGRMQCLENFRFANASQLAKYAPAPENVDQDGAERPGRTSVAGECFCSFPTSSGALRRSQYRPCSACCCWRCWAGFDRRAAGW